MLSLLCLLLAQDPAGERIYRTLCVSCHGAKGEGTKKHPDPLIGTRTLEELARFIDKKMPEDAPEKCVGEDARKVAAYIYKAFYAPVPRLELSRLTVGQYRNAAADLFGEPAAVGPERGLKGEYFNSGRRFSREGRALSRIDPRVDFDFGAEPPVDGVNKDEFAVRWSGAVLAPDTGEYEFTVKSVNGVRLWVNDLVTPLVDAWVRSGDATEHRGTIHLLGGRAYALQAEIFKAKGKEAADNEKTASITLKWKRPRRVEEVIPESRLSPASVAEVLLVRTPFPPDDRSMGFERGTLVSKAWDEATTEAALEIVEYVLARREALVGNDERAFVRRLAERAFRRPVDAVFDGDLKRAMLLILKSPRFLYHEVGAERFDAWDAASRLSFGLWDSLPDRELREAAKGGRLDAARQAERMLADPRANAKVRDFFYRWLNLERVNDLSKPEFNDALISDLRDSLDLFVDDVVWGEGSDFRRLLRADFVYLNGRLSAFYGGGLPAEAPFQKVALDPKKNAGLLTHPLLMAGFAYESTSSPIHRGLFVARSLLGRRLRPPPEAVVPASPDLHPDLTTRERIALQTRDRACQTCHSTINPLGFTLENFDAVGRFRIEEKGKPIDATGGYQTAAGETVRFDGPRPLAEFLAGSAEAHAAFVEQLFQFVMKQPLRAYAADHPETLLKSFVKDEYDIRKLLVEIVASSATKGRPAK